VNVFNLDMVGTVDPEFAMLESEPTELGLRAYKASFGEPITQYWPADAKMQLPEENPGVKLTAVIGNTCSYLIVDAALKDVIVQHCGGVPMEILPLTILDHRGRVYSKDYSVLNPLGRHDAADPKASDIRYVDGEVAGIMKLVLDPKKVEAAPPLFRLQEDPTVLVLKETLADAIRGFSNVVLRRIPVSPPKP
jgi:hypothetical protein